MVNLLAGVFMSLAAFFGGFFGGHASSTPPHGGPMGPNGSSTEMHGMHMGSTTPGMGRDMMGMGPGIFGIVDSANGTTLTVSGKAGPQTATTTYTVDASAAKIFKQKVGTTTVSSIAQGDHVLVQGQVSGTTITAKLIIDGVMPMMGMGKDMGKEMEMERGDGQGMHMGSSTHMMMPMRGMPGNGQEGSPQGSPQGNPQGEDSGPVSNS